MKRAEIGEEMRRGKERRVDLMYLSVLVSTAYLRGHGKMVWERGERREERVRPREL